MESNIDFEKLQKLIDSMYEGNIDDITTGINHAGALIRVNAVLAIAENSLKDDKIIQMLIKLKEDNVKIDGIRVGDYAHGLLDVYGIEKYQGDSLLIKELIQDGFILK